MPRVRDVVDDNVLRRLEALKLAQDAAEAFFGNGRNQLHDPLIEIAVLREGGPADAEYRQQRGERQHAARSRHRTSHHAPCMSPSSSLHLEMLEIVARLDALRAASGALRS